jgi:hypothetical protein
MSPSCVGAEPKDSHKVPEPLPNYTDVKDLVFAGSLKIKKEPKRPLFDNSLYPPLPPAFFQLLV